MKITMYELLGLVKDDKAPKKVKYINSIWKYDKETKDYFNDGLWLIYSMNSIGLTKSEIEIIEEEKKIEKLDIRQEKNIKNNWKWKVYGKEHSYNISTPQKIIADKVNEICDYLKSKGDE